MLKLSTTREVVAPVAPRYRYTIKDENGATIATTRNRDEARNIVRKMRAEVTLAEATQ